ncbi:hypothetical protein PDESU_00550 [Pontiella desulfatans]|uniref:Right handed beta helix domain-containing protein n=2 Tax=Pontiella desulfatans TaxID=2750659 RepID=A0A6C2TWT0_PONDE|nr:hypothetical protein PDESU_00550 [Pontiella desulfatans]
MNVFGLLLICAAASSGSANLLLDPGFEAISGTEPNDGTSPWSTVNENQNGSFVTGTDKYRPGGSQSAKFTFYFDDGAIVQNLTNQVDSTMDYTASIWMLTDEQSSSTNHVNAPSVSVELFTSVTQGSGYTKAGTFNAEILNISYGTWEQFVGTVPASILNDRDGEYIQIRFTRDNPDASHRIWIDDASLTTSIPVAATFYIDAVSGSDTNNGTSMATAWQSLDRVNSEAYGEGSEILLKRNQTHFGKIYLSGQGGSSNAPLVIGAYGTGERPVVDAGGYLAGVHIEDCEHILVRDLEITGDSTNTVDGSDSGDQYGVYVNATWGNSSDFITLTNLHIRDIYPETDTASEGANPTTYIGTAISFQGSGNTSVSYRVNDILVVDCTISNVGYKAISMNRSNRILLEHNMMWDIGGPALQPGRCSNVVVRGNLVDKSGSFSDPRMHGRGSGIWPWTCDDVLIEENTFMHARGRADSCGVHIDFGNRDVIVQRNLSIDNAGGFLEILGNNSNCTYRYNISVDDGTRVKGVVDQGTIPNNQDGHIFWLSGFVGSGNDPFGPYNSYIYNNTIYVNTNITSTFSFQEWSEGVLIANNIFHVDGATTNITGDFADDYTPEMIAGVFWTNNLYSRSGIIPPGFPFEEVDQTIGDPRFAQAGGFNAVDYVPDSSIYVDDKGIVITNIPGDVIGIVGGLEMTEDFFGNPITGAPDMGAIEMALPLEQEGILAGWNYFAPNNNVVNDYVDDSTPDVARPGIFGLIGGEVNPEFSSTGGGSRSAPAYDQIGFAFGGLVGTGSDDAEASGVQLTRDFDGNNHRERLDLKVTNTTGDDIEVNGIHFDIKTNFKGGQAVTNYGTVKVIHFTPVSDLNDAFAWRTIGESNLYNFAWQHIDYTTDAMADVILETGETASFRIEIDWADPAATGDPTWFVDNVAISGFAVNPGEPGYSSWAAEYGLLEDENGDDDDDGLLNLYEYGLGGNPTNGFVDGHIPVFGKAESGMQFIHVQRNDDTNLVYELETSVDLISGTWTNAGYEISGTNTLFGEDFDEVTNAVPTDVSQKFIRLNITSQ